MEMEVGFYIRLMYVWIDHFPQGQHSYIFTPLWLVCVQIFSFVLRFHLFLNFRDGVFKQMLMKFL